MQNLNLNLMIGEVIVRMEEATHALSKDNATQLGEGVISLFSSNNRLKKGERIIYRKGGGGHFSFSFPWEDGVYNSIREDAIIAVIG